MVDVPVRNFRLRGDDFLYLIESRTPDALTAHLWTRRDGQVLPLFRLGTFGLAWWAGDLAHVRGTLANASFAALALVMLLGSQLVAREAGDRAVGLAAMACLGITTVMEPAATWYSASQTLWAGVLVLATLLACQSWRRRGGWWRLVLVTVFAIAASAAWSGGYAAGPAGCAYLWAADSSTARPGDRTGKERTLPRSEASRRSWAAAIPLAASAIAAAAAFVLSGSSDEIPGNKGAGIASFLHGLAHTAPAIPEALVLNNLGLDCSLTALQGAVFCVALGLAWIWSRGGFRPQPLEAAGAALIGCVYVGAFALRAGSSFASLRALASYHTLPQIGAVLLVTGWWSATRGAPRATAPAARSALGVAALVGLLLMLHVPRAQRLLEASVDPLTEEERLELPIPELHRLRAIYLASDLAERQDRMLARIDRAERTAARLSIGRDAIHRAFGRLVVPGWPKQIQDRDAIDLMALPADGAETDPRRIRAALSNLLYEEPATRPKTWTGRKQTGQAQ
jgi:hypothetical protein